MTRENAELKEQLKSAELHLGSTQQITGDLNVPGRRQSRVSLQVFFNQFGFRAVKKRDNSVPPQLEEKQQ